MAIDMQSEQILSMAEAARALPKVDGKRLHTATVWRWARRGCRGVRLEHLRLGHRVVTSYEALGRFAEKLAVKDEEEALCPTVRATPSSAITRSKGLREKQITKAKKRLKAAGIA